MLRDIWLLMQLYWRLDRREVTGQSPWRILAMIAGGVGILFIGVFSAFVGYGLSLLTRPDFPIRVPPGIVPGALLTFVLIGVLVVGLNQSVRALFLSGDLDRLMVAPVHTRAVMVAKLLSRLPGNMLLILIIVAPALIAYGIGYGAGPIYYVLGMLLLLMAPLFGLAVGALIAMLLVRWLPVKRLNELLAAAYVMLGFIIALLFQIPQFYINNDNPEVMFDTVTGQQASSVLEALNNLPIPTFWAGRGLMALDAGQADAMGLLGILVYALTTLGLFVLIILTADNLYMTGWLKTQSAGGKRRGLEEGSGRFGRGSVRGAIAWKDWLQRLRDPRQLVTLIGSGFIAVVVGGIAIFRSGGREETSLMALAQQSGEVEATGILGFFAAAFSPGVLIAAMAMFIGYVFFSNMASYALALEGLSFQTLKAAPIRPRDVWFAKLMGVYWPFVVLFVGAMLVSWVFVRYNLLWLPYALAVGLIIGFGLFASNVSAGFRYANLAWTDPRRMMSTGGGFVSLFLWIIYGVPAALIAWLGYGFAAITPGWGILIAAAALLLLAGVTYLFYRWMLRWGESAWHKLPV